MASTTMTPPGALNRTTSPLLFSPLPMALPNEIRLPVKPGFSVRKTASMLATTRYWPGSKVKAGRESETTLLSPSF